MLTLAVYVVPAMMRVPYFFVMVWRGSAMLCTITIALACQEFLMETGFVHHAMHTRWQQTHSEALQLKIRHLCHLQPLRLALPTSIRALTSHRHGPRLWRVHQYCLGQGSEDAGINVLLLGAKTMTPWSWQMQSMKTQVRAAAIRRKRNHRGGDFVDCVRRHLEESKWTTWSTMRR